MQEKKKGHTALDIKRADCARQLQNITDQQIKLILHAVDNNIPKNLPILQEDVGMAEDIYGTIIPHLKVKTVRCKIQHVEPVNITSVPKTILDKSKEVTICCYLMHINVIDFLNTPSWQIMFAKGIMIKNQKLITLKMGSRRRNYTGLIGLVLYILGTPKWPYLPLKRPYL